jgi:IS1 family transposase/transposase-like protein
MDTTHTNSTRSPLDSLACVNERCELYGQAGQGNLTVRKVYGKDKIRYLRCSCCGEEFSERKGTALWNTKVREATAISVSEHLAEGVSLKGTARLTKVDPSTVRRLNRRLGEHGQAYHEQEVREVQVEALAADERHGYAGNKQTPAWEGELMDPASKFILAHVQGRRDEAMVRHLLMEGAKRVATPQDLVLFTDGDAKYATIFPEVFGVPYRPPRQSNVGRPPGVRYRIPRTLAHVQIIKHRQNRRLKEMEIRYTHGSRKRVALSLERLGYTTPNTSAIERRNGTARRMNAHQTRRSLAFSRRSDTKESLGWWSMTVYNWCRPHRSLRQLLPVPEGKKSTSSAHQLWPSV